MLQSPAVAYTGGIAGLAATKPAKGQKIDPNSADVKKYTDYLKGEHDKSLAKVGGSNKIYDYTISFNGYSANLTESQVANLQKQPDVLAVSENQEFAIDTATTPHFLGLDAQGGLWEQLGGVGSNKKGTGPGEDIVIGIIDSGIWPESKSFSDRSASGELLYQMPGTNRWRGRKCVEGEAFTTDLCNRKLIGGQHFNAAWGGDAALEAARPWEFMSVRDYNGHGTHTAGTAGGNFGVSTTGPSAAFGTVNGIAPRARIAAYKALWSTQDASTASGQTADLVAAIDQAVADGVDVINYSISGTQTNFLDPVEIAYLFAADAGVFVAASAGNSGPTTSTVAHPSPWLTTVAAGTHNRDGIGSVTIDGITYNGSSLASATSGALVDAENSGLPGVSEAAARQCFAPSDNGGAPALDPAKVANKIVLCDRGVNALVNKSLAVKQAGGIGMVLTNVLGGGTNTLALMHSVPTVHVAYTAANYAALHAAADAGKTASIATATLVFNVSAPFTASFSSRGPLTAGGGDLLKPDVIAPGQDILAAVAPPGQQGLEFNLLSGTSMSSPHVAGLGALFKQKHPSWSPMMIKSALMTTGTDVIDAGLTDATRTFRQGGGHVRPNAAANPGLVFNSSFNDWLAFLCGTTTGVNPNTCASFKANNISTDPSDLNSASIAIGDMAGVQTVVRRVTNVGGNSAVYTPAVSGLSGITVAFDPATISIAPGETKTVKMTFRRTTATLGSYTGGHITWSDGAGGHNVRVATVIRPVALGVPAEVTSNGGPVSWTATPGYTGTLNASVRGLLAATETPWTVAQDPDQTFVHTDPTGTFKHTVIVPANSVFRAGIYEDAITPSGTDLDLFVHLGASLVGVSADGDSNEEVTLRTGASGVTLDVYVHGWSTNGPSATGTLFTWVVGPADAGNVTLSGVGPAETGVPQTHTASFSGLLAGKRYLGQVDYSDGSAVIGRTLISVRP